MKKSLIFGGIVGLGVISTPYFMGKSFESKINNSIKEMNKKGIIVENTTKSSYLETISDGKIIVKNGIKFIENLSENYIDEDVAVGFMIQRILKGLSESEKEDINEFLNGMEIKYSSTISNLSTKLIVNGYISKLPDVLEKELLVQTSGAKEIDYIISNKKFSFILKDNRLKINDIKESFIEDDDSFNFNLVGFELGKEDVVLKALNIDFIENKEHNFIINFDNLRFSSDVKGPISFESNLKINKILLLFKNKTGINLENLNTGSSLKISNNRMKSDFFISLDKLKSIHKLSSLADTLNESIINKTDFKMSIDLSTKEFGRLQNIDPTSKNNTKKLKIVLDSVLSNKPNLKINMNSNGMIVNNEELSKEFKVDVDLKLDKVNSIDELLSSLKYDFQGFIKYFDGSFIKVLADNKVTNSVSQILLSQGIKPVKSKTKGLNEVVAKVKNGTLYINDKKMF